MGQHEQRVGKERERAQSQCLMFFTQKAGTRCMTGQMYTEGSRSHSSTVVGIIIKHLPWPPKSLPFCAQLVVGFSGDCSHAWHEHTATWAVGFCLNVTSRELTLLFPDEMSISWKPLSTWLKY